MFTFTSGSKKIVVSDATLEHAKDSMEIIRKEYFPEIPAAEWKCLEERNQKVFKGWV